MFNSLPIEPILPELVRALRDAGRVVLQAPPGAGKTTRVPAYLLESGYCSGRILMLEPRRVAARAAAERLAQGISEPLGQRVGYRIRGESKTSAKTRIEVVTEGILTRMIQSDPELSGVDVLIFDEFHERSLHADLGLALALEVREVLRPDLQIIVMSATLDAAPLAALLNDAPIVTTPGRSHPVETRWLGRPWVRPGQRGLRFESAIAGLVQQAYKETSGGVLVFLPGAPEIRRVEATLRHTLQGAEIMPLYGAMPFAKQRRVLVPLDKGRKVVLATSIAETSLTIPDIAVVVDGGRARRAAFDAGSGMSRLVTERVTRAEAEQRRGRAGRVGPGTCYRLWTKGEEGGLRAFPPPEIAAADLAPLVLELALWGANSPEGMRFLTPPPAMAWERAQALLAQLGALDTDGRITEHGKALAALPTHPRLGQMLLRAGGKRAALLAGLLGARDPLRGAPVDLGLRLKALEDTRKFSAAPGVDLDKGALAMIRDEAKRLMRPARRKASIGVLVALAYPDRIGLNRNDDKGRFLLSGGRGALIAEGDPLRDTRLIAVADLDGERREAKVRLAARVAEAELRDWFSEQIETARECVWSKRDKAVAAQEREMLGAIALSDKRWQDAPGEAVVKAMISGIRDMGLDCLNWTEAARQTQARAAWLRPRGVDMPDLREPALLAELEAWLGPFLNGCRRKGDLAAVDVLAALEARLGWEGKATLDRLAPAHVQAPTGTRLRVDYSAEQPRIAVRLQEMFGSDCHPHIGPDRVPLLIDLLSPARRIVQTTADLPGFWATSYKDVRKDMRGRYPKHPWPEDPQTAPPTRRLKPKS